MGSLCQGLFGSSASTTYQPPEAIKNAVTDILGRAATQSNQPYPQYTPDTAAQYSNYNAGLLAPMTPNQAQAGQSIAGLQGYTAPNFGAATNLVANAANPLQMKQFSQNAVNQYMNPYLNDVVGSAVANINQTNAQQQQQVLGNAIQRGAFGGDRAGIAQAELARQQGLANNATIANLLGQGYSQAQGQFNQQQQTDLATQLQNRNLMTNAGLNLANLGTQGQQAALQQAQAQYGYGTAEQQQQQAGLSTAYQQYMNQQAFPYQQLSYYAGLASGAAPAMGGTTTGYSPTVSNAGGVLGSLGILGGLTNPGAISQSNPWSGISAGIGTIGGLFGLKDGGRANYDNGGRTAYADAGAVSVSPITQAYNDYNNAVAAGAPYDVLQQLYQKYQKSFQGAANPWEGTTTPTATPAKTAAIATSEATPSDNSNRGGNGGGNGPVTARNADYSPDFTNSNGPVGQAGGYGPYYNGGGPGNAFDKANGKGGLSGIMGGLLGGVDKTTGAQTGIMGAFDALAHGNSPGTLNNVLNARNTVAYGTREDGSAYPNTTSGMTAQEFANKFGLDVSQVKGSIVNGQIDWYNGDNKLADMLHAGGLPASQLSGVIGNVRQPEQTDTSGISDPLADGADLAAEKDVTSSGKTINLGNINSAYGLPEGYLGGQLYKESGFNPDATSKESSAKGIAQFTKGTANAMGVNPLDPVSSIYGAATLGQQNAAGLEARGIPATAENLSLAHQFGLAGAAAIIKNPNSTIFDALKTVQDEDKALAAVTGNKYNISDTSKSVYDRVSRDFIASMRAANQKGLDIPTGTMQSGVLSGQPENTLEREQAASAAADAASKGVLASGVRDASGLTENQGIGNAGYNFGLGGNNKGLIPESVGPSQPEGTGGGRSFSEGHGGGGGGLDRTVSAPDNSSNESGSSLGGRGNGPSVSDHSDHNTPEHETETDSGVGGDTTDHSEGATGMGGYSHGGLIHPHHYADGGFTPFHMQYGLPSESDIEQQAQDYAGSGAGVLGPQIQALATKGVLPSAKGGRIHKEIGGGAGTYGDSSNVSLPLNSKDWTDDQIEAASQKDYFNRLHNYNSPPGETAIGRGISNVINWKKPDIDQIRQSYKNMRNMDQPPTVIPKNADLSENEKISLEAMKTNPPPSVFATLTPAQYEAQQKSFNDQKRKLEAGDNVTPETGGGSGDYMSKLTQPVVPTIKRSTMPNRPDEGGGTLGVYRTDPDSFFVDETNQTPQKPSKNTQVAQAAPKTMNDANQEVVSGNVAPGIKQWYNAPPPIDMRQMAALNFGANLLAGGDFGSNLARAGHDYANTMLAQQDQQRATMMNEAQSARERALTGQSEAETAAKSLIDYGLDKAVVSGSGKGGSPIGIQVLPPLGQGEGFTVGAGTTAADGQNAQPGQTNFGNFNASVGRNAYNGQTYGLETNDSPNQQQMHDEIVKQGTIAARTLMPVDHAEAVKNQATMNAEIRELDKITGQSNAQMTANNEITKAIHGFDQNGSRSSGAAGMTKAEALNKLDAVGRTLFGTDFGFSKLNSDNDILNKMRNVAANAGSESKAARWIEAMASTLPNMGLNPDANKTLVSNMYVDNFRKRNMTEFAKTYAVASRGQGTDIETAFNTIKGNEPQRYTDLQNGIVKLLGAHQLQIDPQTGKTTNKWLMDPRTQHFETPVSMYLEGHMTKDEFNAAAYKITGIKNMAAVFGGGR